MKTKNILVGGVTNAGKTVLAGILCEQYGYSRIPGDPLVFGFQQVYPQLGIAHTREGFLESCTQFGKFVVSLAAGLCWESQFKYVLDSFYFRPGDISDIDRSKTAVIFLGYAEADLADKLRQCNAYDDDGWQKRKGLSDAQAKELLQIFVEMSRRDRDDCARLGFQYVETGIDFEASIASAVRILTRE